MLSLPDKFKNDIQGTTTNIHPVVVIDTEPKIYLSQIDEVIDGNHYKGVNLKIPSIKESVSIETRKLKINNITLTMSNVDSFSDKFQSEEFLDKFVNIYWKSQSSTSLSDCLIVYKAIIQRVDHDDIKIKMILEDLTQSIVHRDIPIRVIDEKVAATEKYRNATAPMVYGYVDKAPCILYSQFNAEHGSLVAISPDAHESEIDLLWNVPLANTGHTIERFGGISGMNTNWFYDHGGSDTSVTIFTGRYLNVMEQYTYFGDNSTHDFPEPKQVMMFFQNRPSIFKRLYSEIPASPPADDILQVTILRKATSVKLAEDDLQGVGFTYLGNEDGYYIQDEDNMIDKSKFNYDNEHVNYFETYSLLPNASLNSIDGYEVDEDGFVPITSFKNGHAVEAMTSSSPYPYTYNEGYWWDRDYRFRTHRSTIHEIMQNLEDYPVEIICLPDAEKLHSWFANWANDNTALEVLGFNDPEPGYSGQDAPSNFTQWANVLHWGLYEVQDFSSPEKWATVKVLNENTGAGTDNTHVRGCEKTTTVPSTLNKVLWEGDKSIWNGGTANFQSSQPFPQPLYLIDTNSWNDAPGDGSDYREFGWVVWNKNYMGEVFPHYNYEKLPKYDYDSNFDDGHENDFGAGRIYKDFWEIMGENGYMHADSPNFDPSIHSDIPRFKIEALGEKTLSSTLNPDSNESAYYVANYLAKWNQIPTNIYENTGIFGGCVSRTWLDSNWFKVGNSYSPFADFNEDQNFYGLSDHSGSGYSFTSGGSEGIWNKFHTKDSGINYYVHFTEEVGEGNPVDNLPYGIIIPKGTMFPYRLLEYYISGSGGNMIHTVKGDLYPGTLYNYDSSYINIQAGAVFGAEQRIGLIYSLEDAGVSDNITDMCVTQPYVNIKINNYNEQPAENISDNTTLRVAFLQASTDEGDIQVDEVDLMFNETTASISSSASGENGMIIENSALSGSYLQDLSIYSDIWSNPDDFNAAVIRYNLQTTNSSAQFQFNTSIGNLGVMHVLEVENIMEQD